MTSDPSRSTPEATEDVSSDHAGGAGETLLDMFARARHTTDLYTPEHVEALLDAVEGLRERVRLGEQQAADGNTVPLELLQDPRETQQTATEAPREGTTQDEQGKSEELRHHIEMVEAQRDEYLADLQRLQASFENYRKRIEAETALTRERQRTQILSEILPLLDDLAHLAGSSDAGAAAVAASADSIAARLGLRRIGDTGVTFDPHLHEAVSVRDRSEQAEQGCRGEEGTDRDGQQHPSGPPGEADTAPTVTQVLRPGWQHHQTTLRPALVEVLR